MASFPTSPLFPQVPRHRDNDEPSAPLPPEPANRLVGIARLAADSPLAEAKRGVEYFQIPVRSILNHCVSPRVPFKLTVNPYRGCEFGCKYCYARYAHEYMELDGADFERKIYAKANAGPIMGRDLAHEKTEGEHIAIGTATDPYQPAESEFGVTRAILERMAQREGLEFSITTKSNRIVRDLELLQKINERSSFGVNMTIVTPRVRLQRMLEPRAPRPDLRFAAVKKLREAGIATGVFAMPVIAGLTDRDEDLEKLAQGSREAGASWFVGGPLRLMPTAARVFFPWAQKELPARIYQRLRAMYQNQPYGPESFRTEISAKFEALRRKYGLSGYVATREMPKRAPAQYSLALDPVGASECEAASMRGTDDLL